MAGGFGYGICIYFRNIAALKRSDIPSQLVVQKAYSIRNHSIADSKSSISYLDVSSISNPNPYDRISFHPGTLHRGRHARESTDD